jgi:hypothetical protein
MKNRINCELLRIGVFIVATAALARGQGSLVALHSGAADPTSEGFAVTSYGTLQLGPVYNDLGFDAWSTRVGSGGIYYQDSLPNLSGLSWMLSVNLRVVEDSLAEPVFGVTVDSGQYRFGMTFGSAANGDPIVVAGSSSTSLVLVLQGAGSTYHNYQLAYDAGLGTAQFWVDGVEHLGNIAGAQGFSPAVLIECSHQNPAALQANWNLVSVEIIPEPSTMALVVMGGVLFGIGLFRKRVNRRFAPGGAGAWAALARSGLLPASKKWRSRRAMRPKG